MNLKHLGGRRHHSRNSNQIRTYTAACSLLKKLRPEVDLPASNTNVLRSQPSKKGVLRLSKESDKAAFAVKIGSAVDGISEVRVTEKRITLEIRDVDVMTEQVKVEPALHAALCAFNEARQVKLLNHNKPKLRLAIVILGQEGEKKVENLGHLRVAYFSARIRRWVKGSRCNRAWDIDM